MSVSLCTGEPITRHTTQMCLTSAEYRERVASLDLLLCSALLGANKDAVGLFATRTHWWLTGNLVSTTTPRAFSESCFLASQPPACSGTGGCSSPDAVWHVHLWSSLKLLSAHFSSLMRSLRMAAQPSGVPTNSFYFFN